MNYDTWLQSDKAFEQYHGLDEFAKEKKEGEEEKADREYEKYKDRQLWSDKK